jgi:CHAT domain-containing protein
VEFVRYHPIDPQHVLRRSSETRYIAYIVERRAPPQWVQLGDAAPIDAAIDAVLAAMHRSPSAEQARIALQQLDALVFEPLRGPLANASHLIISPDGKLNLVPFEALRDSQGSYELEHRLISYVTSGRDLLQLANHQAPRSPPTIVAAPDYGPGKAFGRLDGASSEAIEVSAHLPGARMLTGKQATKSALAALAGPAVLHVATHGFFARTTRMRPTLPAVTRAFPGVSFAGAERDMFIEGLDASADPQAYQDPADALDRAGLALANANTGPAGIVTAREIASYDWWGTQLVVLSACETGVGAVPSGDGVYGLRRALTLAGAEAQIVSLWNVSDSSARALMRELYTELEHGAGRAEALRRAKLRMLQSPDFAHPYYWAAFIPTGAWTPLDRTALRPQGRH